MSVAKRKNTPPPRRRIDLASLPVADVPVAPVSGWAELIALPTAQAAFNIFAPMTANGRDTGPELATNLASRAKSVRMGKKAKNPQLEIVFEAGLLTLAAPWTGSLVGLPPAAAAVVRRHNGMNFDRSCVVWYAYCGLEKGFDFEWGNWEMPDNYDGLWDQSPLVPCINGDDIFLYHPARLKNGTLELLYSNHEDGSFVSAKDQHPGWNCLNSVLTWTE